MATRARYVVIRSFTVTAIAIAFAGLVSCDAGAPNQTPSSSANATPSMSVSPEASAFRFEVGDRQLVETVRGRLSERERRAVREAAGRVESTVTDLYVGAFLDPDHWSSGTYDDVFDVFAGVARPEAERRAGILTAGGDAGDRFERIDPLKGRLSLRILLDRGENPVLVASKVRFVARGVGADPLTMTSEGAFLFRRIDGAWRIVSFDVVRTDREPEAA
ncbi:MAG TPA: hypothetical protein VE800_07210 [Actinomycetota bacterium]|jgi:hypothetical protein|nr:hypothetical protein [Actinomycetota bacterium]